jgi:small subunit ribosomal protein S1
VDEKQRQRRKRRLAEVDTTRPAPIRAGRTPSPDEVVTSPRLSELEAIAGMGDMDMDALLSGGTSAAAIPDVGQQIRGRVTRVGRTELFVDVGARVEAYIERQEFPDADVGDEVEAFVLAADDTGVMLSRRLSGQAAADFMEEAAASGVPVEGLVSSRNKGGYEVRIGSVRAFCPISQIARVPLADPDSVVGETLAFLITEMGDKTVVSRRSLQEGDVEESRARFWDVASEGDIVQATITTVKPWGMFVDIDGVDARLPKREATWSDEDDITTMFARGQRIEVRISTLDRDVQKVTVSARDPNLDPWLRVREQLRRGEVYSGTVVSQTEFGSFVRLGMGLQGLLHISRMDGRLPAAGEDVEVRVLSIDTERRRIELAPPSFDPEAQAANSVGAQVTGEVLEVAQAGVRVRLADGRIGWLPQREADIPARMVLAQRFRRGHEVSARIMSEGQGNQVTLTQKSDDSDERNAWRAHLDQSNQGGMGTLGDLLKGLKKG